jgi:hypothetical protein
MLYYHKETINEINDSNLNEIKDNDIENEIYKTDSNTKLRQSYNINR